MKIITGKYKNRKINTIESPDMRPTLGKVREAVFNILMKYIEDFSEIHVLDLCAGSGSLGLEALSRGATSVSFIDNNRLMLDNIKNNLNRFGCGSEEVRFIFADVRNLSLADKSYDLIFFDPPYKADFTNVVLKKLVQNHWVKNGSIIILETHKHTSFTEDADMLAGEFSVMEERVYGISKIVFLRR